MKSTLASGCRLSLRSAAIAMAGTLAVLVCGRLAADEAPQEVPSAYQIGNARVIPCVTVRTHSNPSWRYVDLMVCTEGGILWITDPFFHSDWPHVAMVRFWRENVPFRERLLPSVEGLTGSRPAPSHGGLHLPAGSIVGSRFIVGANLQDSQRPAENVKWYVQLVLLEGCAIGDDLRHRFRIEARTVAHSERVPLGEFPANVQMGLYRARPQDRSGKAGELPVEVELSPVVSSGERLRWEILIRNTSSESQLLFDPFFQYWQGTTSPAFLWYEPLEGGVERQDVLHPDVHFGWELPHPRMCFRLPVDGICGRRGEFSLPSGAVAYTAQLELYPPFLCNKRTVNDAGYFQDMKIDPQLETPLLRTPKVPSKPKADE